VSSASTTRADRYDGGSAAWQLTVASQCDAVRISAKEDYAIRAVLELAAASPATVTRERVAEAQGIPSAFLENIFLELKRAGIVEARRGPVGGFRLALPASDIAVADVIRAVSGPLATVRGARPQALEYEGSAEPLRDLWIAVRASLRSILENVTLADLAAGRFPARVRKLFEDPGAWE
jgi:Rrf2 family protein